MTKEEKEEEERKKREKKALIKAGEEDDDDFDTAEAMNKQMMMMMPIMAVSVAAIAPLGLALYWLVNNITTTIQRIILTKIMKSKEGKIMSNIFEGRTTNEAIENGLKELNVSRKQVDIKVLESEDKRSFLIY